MDPFEGSFEIITLTQQLLSLFDDRATWLRASFLENEFSSLLTDQFIQKWKKAHMHSSPSPITPKDVSFRIPTLKDFALSAEEVIQTKHLLVLLVWRMAHSRSLLLLESSAHVLHELCKTDLVIELCHSPIHFMLCVVLCDALLQKDATLQKRFCELSMSLTSDVLYLLAVLVEDASLDTLLPLEFVYVLSEIMMDRVICLHVTICSLHIFNILIAQAVRMEPLCIDNIRSVLHFNTHPDQTPCDEFANDMFPNSPPESPTEFSMQRPRMSDRGVALRRRSEGYDTLREEMLAQMSQIRLRSTIKEFSLTSPTLLKAFFTQPPFLFNLQCINYATHSQHCQYLSKELLKRLGGQCSVPPNYPPHSETLEKTLIACSFSYLSSSEIQLVNDALAISSSIIANAKFKDCFDLNKLLEDLLAVCRAWMARSLKTVSTALDQLNYLLCVHPCTKVVPVLTVLSRFLRQSLRASPETVECIVKVIKIFSTLINQGVELRPSDLSSLMNVFRYLADNPSTSIANEVVAIFADLFEKQPKLFTPAVQQQLNDILSRIISSPTGTVIQDRCTELLIRFPLDFSAHQFLLWPCLRFFDRVRNPVLDLLFDRVLAVLTQILQGNAELPSSMIRSSALPYLAMILSDDLPADFVLLIAQLLTIVAQVPEADVLFVACGFYPRLLDIHVVAERNGETAVAESIARALDAMRANCPLVVLSLQQERSSRPPDASSESEDLSPKADDAELATEETPALASVPEEPIGNVSQLTMGEILEYLARVKMGEMRIPQFTSVFDMWISKKGDSLLPDEIKQVSERVVEWTHGSQFSDASSIHYLACLDILTRCGPSSEL